MNSKQFHLAFASLFSLAFSLLAITPSPASAQGKEEKFPTRPVEFVVPWGPGGGADQLARKVGQLIEKDLKTSVPVINVPGATGNTGMTKLLAARADGQTMAILIADTLATIAGKGGRWKLDDVTPLAIMVRQPSGIFVKQDSRFKTWDDVVAEAKAKPGTIKMAVLGFGSVDDMTLNYMASKGIKLVPVPFPTPGERYTAILGNHADLLYEQAGDIKSFLDQKQMRPVLFFSEERLADSFPDIPSSKEVGLDVFLPQFRAVVVKAGTDPKRVQVLADALANAAKDPEYAAFLKDSLARPDSFIPANEAGKFLDQELESMKKLAAAGPNATNKK
jgi:tripartite-type tricarboxylate transporter receptor subunit TctC